MTSDDIADLLGFIAETASTESKTEILQEYLQDHAFANVVNMAYNPFITFGVKNIGMPINEGVSQFDENTYNILNDLMTRQLTGNQAREVIREEMSRLTAPSQYLFELILKKDLGAGFGVKLINKARNDFIPRMPYQRCSTDLKKAEYRWQTGIISQEKANGMFANVIHDGDTQRVYTRNGQEIALPAFIGISPNWWYHGELLVYKSGLLLPRAAGNGIINSILKKGVTVPHDHEVVFVAWDRIPLGQKGDYSVPYSERLGSLTTDLKGSRNAFVIDTRVVYSEEEARAHADELIKSGKEGTITKDPFAHWRDGVNPLQVKIKGEYECDLHVIDFLEGTGRNIDTFGSVLCASECGELVTSVAGFTDEHRERMSQFKDAIIAVKFNELSMVGKNAALIHPRYIEIRHDKDHADTLEDIIKIVGA